MNQRIKNSYTRLTSILNLELLKASLPSIVFILIALAIGIKYIDPAPPKKIVIATDIPGSDYASFAYLYREYLKKEGIILEIHQSKGDVENLQLLKDENSGVDMAFIQDGIANKEGAGTLLSLGSLYYDPVWIFCRCKNQVSHLSELKGMKIAVGKAGGGSHVISTSILEASGVNDKNSTIIPSGEDEAEQAILKGKVDVAILVDVPTSPYIREILDDESIQLVNLDEAEAFTRQYRYLHHLALPEGSINLERNIPSHDVQLLSPVVTLVTRGDVHPALIYLMLKTISQVHGGWGTLNKENEFPSDKDTDFPLSDQAASFYKSGLPFLDKYLPFWAATFVNRTLIIIVPLLAILIPLTKIIPTVYIWLIKMKLFRYYGELRFLETQLRESTQEKNHQEFLQMLNEIEEKVNELKLPVSFSQHIYELRSHIELVRTKLIRLDGLVKK